MVENDILGTINKTVIKNFAIYSRNKLIQDIKNKAALIGITESGTQEPLSISRGNIQLFDIGMQEPYRIEGKAIEQRNTLIQELKSREKDSTYEIAYETLIEEVAYTWFNRIIAIRFMEVNNYMPDRMRVLSSGVEGINEPELITHVFETSFEFSEEEKNRIIEFKTDGSNLAMDELFQLLFIKQCNALNASLPELFEKTNDYSELLLTVSYNDIEGVIYKLIHDVPEKDFDVSSESGHGQVEIIGWLYQYYNTEPKAAVFGRPKSEKINKQDIPAATQLFTPEWIVKYMVENSLGRIWIEKLLANQDARTEQQIAEDFGWKYYLPETEQEELVQVEIEKMCKERKDLVVEDITFLDPAMGSFHIGVYAFEVFMQLYESEGYTTREAVRLIIEKNLHGLDIDKRAAQLSYFACMMQARKYNRRILEMNLKPHIYEIVESTHINREQLIYLGTNVRDVEELNKLKMQIVSLLDMFTDAKEYGSLININNKFDFSLLREFVKSNQVNFQISLLETVGLEEMQTNLLNIINVSEILSKKYTAVITNPPYMGSSGMNEKLLKFVKKNYPQSKLDLYSTMIEKSISMVHSNGYVAMITMQSWMNAPTYKEFRKWIFNNTRVSIVNNLGSRAFNEIKGEKVKNVAFVLQRRKIKGWKPLFIDLTGIAGEEEKRRLFLKKKNIYSYVAQDDFSNHELCLIVYKTRHVGDIYYPPSKLEDVSEIKRCIATGSDNTFIMQWFEVEASKISSLDKREDKKWFFIANGGNFRKWYGNIENILNWENDGEAIKQYDAATGKATLRNLKYMFKDGMTYTYTSMGSGIFNARMLFAGMGSIGVGPVIVNSENSIFTLAYINSNVFKWFLETMYGKVSTFETGNIGKVAFKTIQNTKIEELASACIDLAKTDWDSYETSRDFYRHPFVQQSTNIEKIYNSWELTLEKKFNEQKANEEEINRLFIEAYELKDELTPEVPEKNITMRKANLKKDIVTFISYIVGCMLGRYSLDEPGLSYAGGGWDGSKYATFQPVSDNIIPLTDESFFHNDVIELFITFINKVYGSGNLEENLSFIAYALGNRGNNSREVIKNYLINNFFKDHCKMYNNRPIYWLYDSGKQNGFKALVYVHRYDEDTTGKVRVNYLHQVQKAYERAISNLQEDMADSKDAKEITHLQKKIEKFTKQLKECKEYDERLGHIALDRIPIDLDDGVKVNYQKVQTDSKGNFHQILAEI